MSATYSGWPTQASYLPHLKDLDRLDMRFLAPPADPAFCQRTAYYPFGVAARRDSLGPDLTWWVRGEVDHDTMRVRMVHAAALVQLASGIKGLELNAHNSLS